MALGRARRAPPPPPAGRRDHRRYEGIYAIGFGLAAFGLADVTIGNGLIAAFVAGIAMGAAEHEIPDAFVEFAENVSAIFQVITFFVFGALIVATGYDGEVWRLVVFILLALLVARPVGDPARLRPQPAAAARRSCSSPGSGRRASPRCCSPSSS